MTVPLREATIADSEDNGLFAISLVDDPAIQVRGVAMRANGGSHTVARPAGAVSYQQQLNAHRWRPRLLDTVTIRQAREQQIIATPLLIPDQVIYRDQDGEQFGLVWRKEVIKQIFERWQRRGDITNLNIQHSDVSVSGFIKNLWLVEQPNDDSNKYIYGLPTGTLFALIKITKASDWQLLKRNGFTNASIEALVNFKETGETVNFRNHNFTPRKDMTPQESGAFAAILRQMAEAIEGGTPAAKPAPKAAANKQPAQKPVKQSFFDKLFGTKPAAGQPAQDQPAGIEQDAVALADYVTADGNLLSVDDETGQAFSVTPDGQVSPAAAGEYEVTGEDGQMYTVVVDEGGLVASIEAREPTPEEMQAAAAARVADRLGIGAATTQQQAAQKPAPRRTAATTQQSADPAMQLLQALANDMKALKQRPATAGVAQRQTQQAQDVKPVDMSPRAILQRWQQLN